MNNNVQRSKKNSISVQNKKIFNFKGQKLNDTQLDKIIK